MVIVWAMERALPRSEAEDPLGKLGYIYSMAP